MEALEILWPTVCAGCDATGQGRLCAGCRELLGLRRIETPIEGVTDALAASSYDSPIGVALQRAKYGRDRGLMQVLAKVFADTLAPFLGCGPFDAVVAVPSPWTRRAVRGFSTGALLAHAVAARSHIPWVPALRIAPGKRNAGLNARARRANLAGRVRATHCVHGAVLMVDDVVTTGTTARSCARELLGGTTSRVFLASLCLAVTPGGTG